MKKIGFIAMSGVRAHNEELTRLGLTLPGFVERNRIIASMPSLSLLTLAALTPGRFEVEYHEVADLKNCAELPDDFDLVVITSFSAQIFEGYKLADQFRTKNIPVVMGGLHVTACPEEAKQHCTSVVLGEGEPLWPQVLEDFQRGELKPYYQMNPPGLYDLNESPVPRYDLLDPAKYNRLTVQTSRGCPHKCTFCASSILLTPRYKVKRVENVLREIRAIKKLWPKPFIEFADDNSFVQRPHSKELLRALVDEDLRWFTEADVRIADDPELLGLMRDAGCQQVLIGLESPRRQSLDGVELKQNWKMKRVEEYKTSIDRIQSYGITVNGCFILGLDGDTPDVFQDVLEFVRESGLYEVQITFLTAFPGTPLYQQLKSEGRILRERAWELCTLFDINFQPKNMSVAELQSGFLGLARQLYSKEETDRRRRSFKARLKSSPHFRPKNHLSKMGVNMAKAQDLDLAIA